MHQTSLGGRCFAAEAMNAAAPRSNISASDLSEADKHTLPYPDVRMIQEAKGSAHELPYPHLLEQSQFAQASQGCKHFRDDAFLHVWLPPMNSRQ